MAGQGGDEGGNGGTVIPRRTGQGRVAVGGRGHGGGFRVLGRYEGGV